MRKTLAAAILMAAAIAGCTPESENAEKTDYPQEARDNFVDSCAESAARTGGVQGEEARNTCTCVVDGLQDRLPYRRDGANNDFTDADRIIRDDGELPSNLRDTIDEATADCRPDS